jgi:hypothetical protein
MTMRRPACFCAIVLACGVAGAAPPGPDLDQVEELIVRRTNEFRVERGLARVEPDAALGRAARDFADYMARTDRYGHEADGRKPSERARSRGYDLCYVSENIAYQVSTGPFTTAELARGFVEGWKESPGHRRNMLAPEALETAAAAARSARTGRYYAVQMFGRPRAHSVEFTVANMARSAVRYRVGEEGYLLGPSQARIHTVCVAEDVTFPAGRNGESRKIRPSHGDRLRVEGDLRVTVGREP